MELTRLDDVFGFRFLDTLGSSFYELFAAGHQRLVWPQTYDWDGQKRIDGPLLLFQYTVSGYGYFEINGKIHKVQEGKAFMVDIPSEHRYYFPETSSHWEIYFLLLRPSNLTDHWEELMKKMGHVIDFSSESSPVLLLQRIIQMAKKDHIQDGFQASSMVYQFVMEMYRYSQIYTRNRAFWNEKVIRAVENMEKNYATLHSLDDIASSVQLSKYHFSRLFLKTTGSSPIEYLSKVRIRKSIELLYNSEMTIDQIAKAVGYSNGSYFIKVFHQWIGYSPGEFRKREELTSFNHFTFD